MGWSSGRVEVVDSYNMNDKKNRINEFWRTNLPMFSWLWSLNPDISTHFEMSCSTSSGLAVFCTQILMFFTSKSSPFTWWMYIYTHVQTALKFIFRVLQYCLSFNKN